MLSGNVHIILVREISQNRDCTVVMMIVIMLLSSNYYLVKNEKGWHYNVARVIEYMVLIIIIS